MKTKQLTLLSYFFEDFRVIDKIFKGTKQKLVSIDFDMPENESYAHLTDVDTYKNIFPLHTDFENVKNGLTSIYYVNTNNGGTAFENGKFVKSEQNKLVTFPMHFKHRAVPHTDFSYARIVININYTR